MHRNDNTGNDAAGQLKDVGGGRQGQSSGLLSPIQADQALLAGFVLYILVSRLARRVPFLADLVVLRLILGEVVLIIPAFIFLHHTKVSLGRQLGLDNGSRVSMKLGIGAAACSYPVVIILNILSMHFASNNVAQVLPEVLELGLMPALAVMALLPALAEEFLFRGILYRSYRTSRGSWPLRGALQSAFLFGLMHMDLNQMPYAVFLGIVFALMVEAFGTIEISVFMHFLFNGTSVLLSYSVRDTAVGDPSSAQVQETTALLLKESVSMQGILIMIVVSLISIGFLLLVLRKAFRVNGKSLGDLVHRPDSSEEYDIAGNHNGVLPVDLWLAVFILAAAGMTWYLYNK